ncbi:membrane protein [Planomonospora venezuelensis]|nr:membrane protein [Planomonospora venezuelensis]
MDRPDRPASEVLLGDHDAPTRTDPVAAAMSEVVGGPLGDHAAGHRWWDAGRVLAGATALTLAAGLVSKAACVPSGWSNQDQPFTELCWTDLAGTSVDAGSPPRVAGWLEQAAEWLPGTGTVVTTAVLAVLLAALALLATALLVRVDRRRPWAAAGWALGPVLLVHWLSWELVAAVGLAVLLWGWTSGRAWLAGVGAGVAAAFALPVAVAFVGVVAVGGRLRDRVDALLAAAAAYVVVTLPGRATAETPDIGSVWFLLARTDVGGSATTRTVVQVVVLALAAGAVWWLVRRAGRPSPLTSARAGLVLLAAALAVAPSAPPETALLVLPLAAIAVRRWRDLLVWQALHLLSWVLTGWYVGQVLVPTVADDVRAYWLAVLLRVGGLVWLVAAVLRDAAAGSVDDDAVEVGRREPDPDLDVLADAGDPRP